MKTGTVSVWMMHYPMDRSKVHEVILERTRSIAGYGFNDDNYYEVKKGA
ncbi:unnamed protein product [marine sediment metagenome]|uniref:Uncharacterized protein n=1 Tax=marine sediment metagenome TaxID=412755 RepID=X1E8Z2_9ZZZZ